jgi:hypothetical protein
MNHVGSPVQIAAATDTRTVVKSAVRIHAKIVVISAAMNHEASAVISAGTNHVSSAVMNHEEMNHAASAGMNCAASAGMNHAASAGMNHAASAGMNHAASAGMNQALIVVTSDLHRIVSHGTFVEATASTGAVETDAEDVVVTAAKISATVPLRPRSNERNVS